MASTFHRKLNYG